MSTLEKFYLFKKEGYFSNIEYNTGSRTFIALVTLHIISNILGAPTTYESKYYTLTNEQIECVLNNLN